MSNQNLITWDRFAAIYLTPSGYAIALFIKREDRVRKTLELIDIVESSRISTNDICEKLGEYSTVEYMDRQEVVEYPTGEYIGRQEVVETGVIEDISTRLSPVLMNGGETIAKEIGRNYPVMSQDRAGLIELASSINDGILTIEPSLEKEVKRKIAAVGSAEEIDSNPYISAILMGVAYLGWIPSLNIRNMWGGSDNIRPRTDDDPEYIPNPVDERLERIERNSSRESRTRPTIWIGNGRSIRDY